MRLCLFASLSVSGFFALFWLSALTLGFWLGHSADPAVVEQAHGFWLSASDFAQRAASGLNQLVEQVAKAASMKRTVVIDAEAHTVPSVVLLAVLSKAAVLLANMTRASDVELVLQVRRVLLAMLCPLLLNAACELRHERLAEPRSISGWTRAPFSMQTAVGEATLMEALSLHSSRT
jgi:hypothetical protein